MTPIVAYLTRALTLMLISIAEMDGFYI